MASKKKTNQQTEKPNVALPNQSEFCDESAALNGLSGLGNATASSQSHAAPEKEAAASELATQFTSSSNSANTNNTNTNLPSTAKHEKEESPESEPAMYKPPELGEAGQTVDNLFTNSNSSPTPEPPEHDHYMNLLTVDDGGILPNELFGTCKCTADNSEDDCTCLILDPIKVPMSARTQLIGAIFEPGKFRSSDLGNVATPLAMAIIQWDVSPIDLLALLQGLLCDNQVTDEHLKTHPGLAKIDVAHLAKHDHTWAFLAKHEHFTYITALSVLSVCLQTSIYLAMRKKTLSCDLSEPEHWGREKTRQEFDLMAKESQLQRLIDEDEFDMLKPRKLLAKSSTADRNCLRARRAFVTKRLVNEIETDGFAATFIWGYRFESWVGMLKMPMSLKSKDCEPDEEEAAWYTADSATSRGLDKCFGRYVLFGSSEAGENEGCVRRVRPPSREHPEGVECWELSTEMIIDGDENEMEVMYNPPLLHQMWRRSHRTKEDHGKVASRTEQLYVEWMQSIVEEPTQGVSIETSPSQTKSRTRTRNPGKGNIGKGRIGSGRNAKGMRARDRRVRFDASAKKWPSTRSKPAPLVVTQPLTTKPAISKPVPTVPAAPQSMTTAQCMNRLAQLEASAANQSDDPAPQPQPPPTRYYQDLRHDFPKSQHADPDFRDQYMDRRNAVLCAIIESVLHFVGNAARAFKEGDTFNGRPMNKWFATTTLRYQAMTMVCQYGAFYSLPHINAECFKAIVPDWGAETAEELDGFMDEAYARHLVEWKKKKHISAEGIRMECFKTVAGWEIDMADKVSGVVAELMKHDKIRKELQYTDSRLKARGLKRDKRMMDRMMQPSGKRRKYDNGRFERSMFDDDPPPPPSQPNPTDDYSFRGTGEMKDSEAEPSYLEQFNALHQKRQDFINTHSRRPLNTATPTYGVHGGFRGNSLGSGARASHGLLGQNGAIREMQRKLSIPRTNCANPKGWAERNAMRGIKKLSPFAHIVDKDSGVFSVLSREGVAMQTQAPVATATCPWMNWDIEYQKMKSLHEQRKSSEDTQTVVGTVRGLIVCLNGEMADCSTLVIYDHPL